MLEEDADFELDALLSDYLELKELTQKECDTLAGDISNMRSDDPKRQ